MTVDRAVLLFAGLIVLVSLALGYYVSPYWYLLTAFVGLNLIQASFTGFCPAAIIFKKLGIRPGEAFH
ncbi:MAG: DUF2892 domain-containing protein [Hyphomicrobium sp.]|nr:DUF2892 domain-containing protein [Hyphomicrobium sp.]MBN9263407.1 DUF2892 domain-containing protein [Hyphomicrobium sp.]MBN9279554.1 DUF2892 domain-containing protein [Hyphomicrobium sp.]